MKKTPLRAATMVLLTAATSASAQSPIPHPDAVITDGNTRLTILTPQMIRIEHSPTATFEDNATFAIQNRQPYPHTPAFTVSDADGFITITTDSLRLNYRKGSDPMTVPPSPDNLSISFLNPLPGADTLTVRYPGKPDPLNLLGTTRTLDCSNGDNKLAEMEQGVVSRSGWAVIDDSPRAARLDGSHSLAMRHDPSIGFDWWTNRADSAATDLYFLGYGHDYTRAIADFTRVAGKIPLPPRYAFGYWYSKYDAYSSSDFRAIMDELKANSIPADVMIIDMDWHWNGNENVGSKDRGGWTGWSWNTNLIPDPEQLLADMHSRGFRVALNLHPATGINKTESPQYFNAMTDDLGPKYTNPEGTDIPWNLDYPDFTRSFFSNIIRDHEREGVDFWWLDWQQHLTSPYTPGLGQTFRCNHVFFNEMSHNRPDRRPIIFHRWGGLGSHRYQIGFSGDTFINFPTLAFQPWFTSTAANVGYAYWGHDLGGHAIGNPDEDFLANNPELFLRWLQFGVFSPIFRTHATNDPRIERRMWKFPNFPLMLDAVRLRYSLIPYIYTMARKTYDSGLAICRPMYYSHPEAPEAYTFKGQYMFGDDILVAPVTAPADSSIVLASATPSPSDPLSHKEIWFPEGQWWDVSHNRLIQGPAVETIPFAIDEIPYFFRAGAIIPTNPSSVTTAMDNSKEIILHIVAGADGTASLYEDAGDNPDYSTNHHTTAFTLTSSSSSSASGPHTLSITPSATTPSSPLPDRRAWTLAIHNADAPTSLLLDGTPLPTGVWTYDPDRRLLTVSLPYRPTSRPLLLTF